MKKFIVLLVFLVLISPVFAQPDPRYNQSDIFYVNISVDKVYPTGMGYIVQYRGSGNQFHTIGIPQEWFSAAASKAELINLPPGRSWPTMTIFYRDGEFSHVRLYVHRAKSHQTWGNIPMHMDVSMYFPDTDTLNIEF